MKEVDLQSYQGHQEVWLLLPWYLNGSLNQTEHQLVDKHVKVCVACRTELNNLKKLSYKVKSTESLEVASRIGYKHLKKRLAVSEKSPIQDARTWWRQSWAWLTVNPHKSWAVALSLVLGIGLLSHGLGSGDIRTTTVKDYYTLAQTQPDVTPIRTIRVTFAATLAEADVNRILNSLQARAIADKSTAHSYLIEFEEHEKQAESMLAALISLRNTAGVIAATPLSTAEQSHENP